MRNLVEKARRYATSGHARINHLRKYTLQPYDVHLRAVARLVDSVSDDSAMVAAAWLHDIVEDTPATFEDVEREFGADVMNLVKELTDISRPSDGNRAARKAIDRQHLAGASPRAKTIKLADLIDNCDDICRHDPEFGQVYLVEMRALMEVLREGNLRLYAKAEKKIADCTRAINAATATAGGVGHDPSGAYSAESSLAGQPGIRRFAEAFTARDIMEPLVSHDAELLPGLMEGTTARSSAPVFGIRTHGVVTGYLPNEAPAPGGQHASRPFDTRQLVDLDGSLADVIHVLTLFSFCFVTLNGAIIGVIGRGDIEKPAVRMWLFGIIILVEMLVVDRVRSRWPDESWVSEVSAGRLEKARELQAERRRRGLNADLLECLQFSDKMQVAMRDPAFIESAGFNSIAAAKRALKDLEALRNNLAHGQDISRHDWPPIVRLARRIQEGLVTASSLSFGMPSTSLALGSTPQAQTHTARSRAHPDRA